MLASVNANAFPFMLQVTSCMSCFTKTLQVLQQLEAISRASTSSRKTLAGLFSILLLSVYSCNTSTGEKKGERDSCGFDADKFRKGQ